MKNISLAALMAVAVAGFTAAQPAAAVDTIKVDGSSTVFPITEAVAEEFQIAKRGKVHVTVGISGTGGGFKRFCRGETDISDASRPITASEIAACAQGGVKYIELPVAYDALTVVVNPKATWVDQITIAELNKMWAPAAQGVVSRWNQVNPKWPNVAFKLYGAGTDSGTFDYFTEAVNGRAKSSRGDYTASEDDNVLVQGVEADVNALGYFGYAYFAGNASRMKALKIVNKEGKAVGPSEATVLDGTYNPMSRPLFIYVNAESAKKPFVKDFIEFYLGKGASFVKEVKYVPFNQSAYDTALKHFRAGRVGSVFNGVAQVGITVEDLLKKEAR